MNKQEDLISRQDAIDALNGIINRFEQILRDIRESKVDDSVCGMCEYDGAYIGQSGDWCNECPGFDKDDCFKLSDKCRKRWLKSVDLPSAQPERKRGEWYKPKEYPRDSYRYICSNCQDVAYYVTGNNGKKQKEDKPKCGYRYCPNCGARMTERRTDE